MKQKGFIHISHSIISVCFVKYHGILIECEIKEYKALTLLYITIKIGLNFLLSKWYVLL